MHDEIKTADEAIDACGGSTAVAHYFGVDVRVVSNWRTRGLPPETYVAFSKLLIAKDKSAPASLWRQREPAP